MYKKIKLTYSYDGLEPYISKETMEVHYKVLYTNYLNRLNEILSKNHFSFRIPKEDIYNIIDRFPIEERGDILFYLGGVINHEMYFSQMIPKGKESRDFLDVIHKNYLSFPNFIDKFLKKASELRGSGYTFLVLDRDKELALVNLPNQDSPYRMGLFPIMNLDVWEHAYFLDYQADKNQYFQNFFQLVDFEKVYEHYEDAIKKIC